MSLLIIIISLFSTISLHAEGAITETFQVKEIFDGNQWIKGHPYIVIRKGVVSSIQRNRPDGEVYDYKNLTIIPGLIDAHQHFSFEDTQGGDNLETAFIQLKKLSRNQKVERMLKHLRDHLNKGFLYVRDLGGDQETINLVAEKLRAQKELSPAQFPSLYYTPMPLAVGHGQCPAGQNCSSFFNHLEKDQIIIKRGSFLKLFDVSYDRPQKIIKVYGDNEPFKGQSDSSDLINLLKQTADYQLPVAIHLIRPSSLEPVIPFLRKNSSLEHLNHITRAQAKKLETSKAKIIPTDFPQSFIDYRSQKYDTFDLRWEKERQDARLKLFKGLKPQLCFGSDFYYKTENPIKTRAFFALELFIEMASKLKLKTTEALKMITSNCHELFPESHAGYIRVGEKANFIGIEGDLKEDLRVIHNSEFIMRDGVIIRRN